LKALDAAAVGVVLTVAVQAPSSFQALTSAVVNIRTHADTGGSLQDIRDAEVISAAVVALVGVAGAVVTRSPVPIVAALLADAVMVGIYEYALRTQHCLQGSSSYGTGTVTGPDGY
jgi:hypothetical protein